MIVGCVDVWLENKQIDLSADWMLLIEQNSCLSWSDIHQIQKHVA